MLAQRPITEEREGGLEARVGIEPTHKGFADLSLTAWVPRPETESIPKEPEIWAGGFGEELKSLGEGGGTRTPSG